ncbi:NodT family efflux transporter outer membrane factor (OMF) lipoprotein [Marinobacter persicus]|uniref:NodT family efflux transporter outer membrane factor (OMF) lipoprotein n=1 Tax=Marinobacter persicus TaxID=930118 RepID=A0A2S6G7M8_9GAMM|nr:MAG: outer membrane protein [Marinobacter sp. T13-3]PPK52125.1 NodT family efflux transporter outer membrane factor (OMF) lipoprotein [Marinobacter persicus]PPK55187.1 NodT family efflux transporter outer membrane factor (OMF) lipoprotein [Marinobacter persicus]PPK58885.1 NodT family efflux transporter outer membrane factor (OMF) lipoprotein [Marinobacter persicus]
MPSLCMTTRLRFLLLLIPVILGGCATSPGSSEPQTDITDDFSRRGELPLNNQWWQAFGDPDLNQLVKDALAGNFSLAANYQRLLQARATAERQAAGLWPSLDASLGAERQESETTSTDTFSTSLSASYEVDLWGRVQALTEAEELRAAASQSDYEAAAVSLSGEIANTWFQLVEQRAQLALARDQLQTNLDVLSLIETRFTAGQSGSPDVLRQRQLVSASRERLTTLEGDIRVLENQLAVLTGQPPLRATLPESARLPSLPPLPQTGVPGELVQRRPDVQQAWRLVQAADRDLAAAISNRFPRLSLEASISNRTDTARELFDNWLATLAGNLVAPLVDGGERRAEVTRSRAVLEQRVQEYRQTVLTAIQEVEDALTTEHQQQQRLERLEQQIDLAGASYRQLRTRYLNGAVSYIEVLNALQDRQDLQRTRLTARQQLLNARVALYRALAGSIEPQNDRMESNQT